MLLLWCSRVLVWCSRLLLCRYYGVLSVLGCFYVVDMVFYAVAMQFLWRSGCFGCFYAVAMVFRVFANVF